MQVQAGRRERRLAQTRLTILDAAGKLFLTQGLHSTTMAQLAEEADVAIGTLYGHFDGKNDVYAALVDRALELDAEYCDAGWNEASNPLGRLIGIADGYLRFAREHPDYFRLFRFPPADGPTADSSECVSERVRSEIERMAGAIREAIDDGLFRAVDPDRTAAFMWASWDGVIAAHLLPGNMGLSDDQFEEVLAVAREVIALGLLKPGAAA
ncbi:MAG: TetR/AcrR family transcriptional regulator [Thermoleophilaceae bacterium]|nr:TetR/AcrR family transcriptional regulator [Thermoleophilaceae bacterium]